MKNRPRTCLGCRGKFDKRLLLRVAGVIDDRGVNIVKYDPDAKLQGRGAWVCKKRECIERTRKNRAFERTLNARATEDLYEELSCVM